jgi:hypothetical protein
MGIAGANALGVNIAKLDFKQLGAMCLSGGIVGMLMYLKQSPVPPDGTTFEIKETSTITGTMPTATAPATKPAGSGT